MNVLIVDCYDSFTFNLYQQVGRLGGNPVVLPCDAPLGLLQKSGCDRICTSPRWAMATRPAMLRPSISSGRDSSEKIRIPDRIWCCFFPAGRSLS